jgi:TRAP-type C4-dicarboxylate transport system permease small subunit
MSLLAPLPNTPFAMRQIDALVEWTIVAIGALMIVLVFTNVVTHLFQKDIAWTTELCELLMVWATFIGGAAAARRGAHMSITEFLDKLSEKQRLVADAALQVFAIAVLALLTFYGLKITQSGWSNELTVLGWPMATQYAALPVASMLTIAFILWDLVLIARGIPRAERYGE